MKQIEKERREFFKALVERYRPDRTIVDRRPYVAIYGDIELIKGYCESCCKFAFIIDGKLKCCGESISVSPLLIKRESEKR